MNLTELYLEWTQELVINGRYAFTIKGELFIGTLHGVHYPEIGGYPRMRFENVHTLRQQPTIGVGAPEQHIRIIARLY